MDSNTPLIQRYPYDLLRPIFQDVVEDTPYLHRRMSVSIGLSRVCRSWRHIAVQCPMLWRHITFYMIKMDLISEMAQVLVSRASMVPVTICVDYTGAYNTIGIPPRGALNYCLLDRFPVLHALKFRFDNTMEKECIDKHYNSRHDGIFNLMDIFDNVVHLPQGPIDKLFILHRNTRSESGLTLSFTGVEEFISKLSPSRSLELNIPSFKPSQDSLNWFTLQDLTIFDQELIPSILLAVPNLRSLELAHITGYYDFVPAQIISLPNLRVLNLNYSSRYRDPARVLCPNLRKLTITSDSTGSWGLFSINPELTHLTTLTLDVDSEAFCDIARLLPQIRVLSTAIYRYRYKILKVLSNWWIWGFKEPPFPGLQELTIEIWENAWKEEYYLSLDTFNDFVCNRLLPFSHPTRGIDAANVPIQRFIIRQDVKADDEWINSPYIELFDFEMSENSKERTVTMKWPIDC